ncbi:hypothetical protein ADL00_40705, partial [Streptomyces sp. AS58]|uniref:hypothetical protein n=1 Tax=Streptomyces sp. AS58 TaxID=1519489 RepID=UPI0006AF1999
PTLTPAGLRERHLALLATLIGDLTPTPQHSQTWDTARTTTTPVTRRSLWIDPISLPQPTDNTTTTEIPAHLPPDSDSTTPTTAPEPTLTPFKSGNFEFTNLNHTNTTYRDKAVRIIELLGEHPTIRDYIGRRPCRITLHVRTRETPADVRDLDADGVQINLASYYFEKYDIGFVMGMLAHEIGLHPLASRNTDITVEERGLEDLPLPVPGLLNLSTPRTMSTEGAGQADHIMAAFPSTTRHRIYRRIVVEMAEVLAREARSGAGSTKLADVTDLFDCYLMDLASIAVTNDHRMSAAAEPGYTARVYNAYKDLLHAELSTAPALRALLPSNKSMFGVINDFRRIGTYIAINNRGDSIQSVPTA